MQIVAHVASHPQVDSVHPQNFLLACPRRIDLSRALAQATMGDPGSTSRRQASRARHVVAVLRKMHSHCASCSACLVREALAAGGAQ